MAVDSAASLEPRRQPRQQRAREAVGRILDATAELLDEQGFERLTTNAIAERSGLNVASLYGYFPNKFAVMAALWERTGLEQRAYLARALEQTGGPTDPIEVVRCTLIAFSELALREPGHAELSEAMRSAPELAGLWEAERVQAVRQLSLLLRSQPGFAITPAQTALVVPVLIEAASGVSRLLRAAPRQRRARYVAELDRLLTAYLETYRIPAPAALVCAGRGD